jgi:hypothetical protein
MRKRFSERYGFKKPRETFQIENMDIDLRNRLWNKFREYYIYSIDYGSKYFSYNINNEEDKIFFKKIYDEFFKTKDLPKYSNIFDIQRYIELLFFKMAWYEVYDFIEYIANIYWDNKINEKFKQEVNKVLEKEMSGYRFVGDYIAPIIDEVEIKEIEDVFDSNYEPVKRHLANALELLSDRENPDYINSIKESITAVEAIVQVVTDRKTDLGSCLKELKKKNYLDLNKEFINGLTSLYSWTNKEDGIRHAHTGEELKTTFEEAKYMLVSCSAFINYLIAKYEKAAK